MRRWWCVPAVLAVVLFAAPAMAAAGGRLDNPATGAASPTPAADDDLDALRKTAAHGDAEAMYDLAMVYRDGEGTPKDLKKALYWFRKSAARGKAEAMNELGCAYSKGAGVTVDYVAALGWFRRGAARGDIIAMLNIGVAYDLGQGVPADDAEAVRWYLKAAEGGDPTAALYLASMYERAEGVKLDFAEAARGYGRAARREAADERAGARAGLERVGDGALPIAPPRDATSLTAT